MPESAYPYTVGGCIDPAEGDNNCFENRCPTSPQFCRNCRAASAPAGPRYQLSGTGFGRTAPGSKDELLQVCWASCGEGGGGFLICPVHVCNSPSQPQYSSCTLS